MQTLISHALCINKSRSLPKDGATSKCWLKFTDVKGWTSGNTITLVDTPSEKSKVYEDAE